MTATNARDLINDRLGTLAADRKAHEDALASILAEQRGLLFALDALGPEEPIVDAPREEAPRVERPKRTRRTRAQIQADNAAIGPRAEEAKRNDDSGIPAFLDRRHEAPKTDAA